MKIALNSEKRFQTKTQILEAELNIVKMPLILNERKEYKYKMVLLGFYSVGKSSITSQYVKGTFDPHEESTIGAAYMTKTAFYPKYTIKFEIWDTAGQERYNSLAPMYYRNAHVALLVYDITSRESFEMAKKWHRTLREEDEKMKKVLIGNKIDLDSSRTVSEEEGKEYASQNNLMFFELSAKTGFNVDNVFSKIADVMPKDSSFKDRNDTIRIKKRKKFICC